LDKPEDPPVRTKKGKIPAHTLMMDIAIVGDEDFTAQEEQI
jgi:hypothetical protein